MWRLPTSCGSSPSRAGIFRRSRSSIATPALERCRRRRRSRRSRDGRPNLRAMPPATACSTMVADVYAYLMRTVRTGDTIFIFGFSRGAFTARVVAGLIHRCGVLKPEFMGLIPYALDLYRPHEPLDDVVAKFVRLFSRPWRVHFLGLWDTVKAFGVIWPKSLPHLRFTIGKHRPARDGARRAPHHVRADDVGRYGRRRTGHTGTVHEASHAASIDRSRPECEGGLVRRLPFRRRGRTSGEARQPL